MKKILLCVPLLAIFAAGFFGCSQQRQWNHEQRKAMREALRSYRQMVYLDDLNDAEFVLFSDEVAGQLDEQLWPFLYARSNYSFSTTSLVSRAIISSSLVSMIRVRTRAPQAVTSTTSFFCL